MADSGRAALPPRQLGAYQLLQVLGEGSSGTVYLARRPGIERLFALKLLAADLDPEGRERVKREARIASRIDHPGIVRVLEIDAHRDRLYLVMDHAPGPTLRERLDKGGAFEPAEAASVVAALADALHAAHAVGIVHRDVKPDNVVLDGKTGRPRILDFGVASDAAARTKLTQAGQVLGTPYYMSPEQVRGEPAAPAADIYALGVVLYELLTGVRPFEGLTTPEVCRKVLDGQPAPPSTHAPGLDPRIEQVVLMAMAARAEDRFPSAAGLAEALRSSVSQSGEGAGSSAALAAASSSSGEGPEPASAGPWPALVAGALFTFAVVGLTGWVALERREARLSSEASSALGVRMGALGDQVRDLRAELEALRTTAARREARRADGEREADALADARGRALERLSDLLRAAAEPRVALGDALPRLVERLAPIPGTARLRAQLLLDAGAPGPAVDIARAAISAGDHDPELLVHAMRALVALRQDADAREVHAQLVRRPDTTPERAYALLQTSSVPLGDRLAGAQRAMPFPADAAYLHAALAELLSEAGLRERRQDLLSDAVAAGDAAVAADPASAESYTARSTALYHTWVVTQEPSLTARVVADLRSARQISPSTYHWIWAGKSYVLTEQPMRAVAELEVALASVSRGEPVERANALAWLGSAYLLLGREDEARAAWLRAIGLAPLAAQTYDFATLLPRASPATRQAVLDAAPEQARRELQRMLDGGGGGRRGR